jgi:acyl carrier protein
MPAPALFGGILDMSVYFEKIKKIVANNLQIDEETITIESSFVKDLGADSLDIVELLMEFEDCFGITIPNEAAEKFITIKDVVDFVVDQKK